MYRLRAIVMKQIGPSSQRIQSFLCNAISQAIHAHRFVLNRNHCLANISLHVNIYIVRFFQIRKKYKSSICLSTSKVVFLRQ